MLRGLDGGVSRPTPWGDIEGSAQGVSRPTPRGNVEGSGQGGFQAHTQGDVEGSGQGGLQAHTWGISRSTPGGGCIPACTEADIPAHSRLLPAVRILLECVLVLLKLRLNRLYNLCGVDSRTHFTKPSTAYSHQEKAGAKSEKDQRINDKYQGKFSLSLGVNGPEKQQNPFSSGKDTFDGNLK